MADKGWGYFAKSCTIGELPDALRKMADFLEAAPERVIWRHHPEVRTYEVFEHDRREASLCARWMVKIGEDDDKKLGG